MTLRAFITCLLFLESLFHHWLFIAPKKNYLIICQYSNYQNRQYQIDNVIALSCVTQNAVTQNE